LAKVTLKGLSFQETYGKDISGRIFVDLTSADGTNQALKNAYNKHIEEVSARLVNLTARKVDADVRKFYNEGVTSIQKFLKTGIPGRSDGTTLIPPKTLGLSNPSASIGTGKWKSFSPRYYKAKSKRYKKTRNLFWVRRSEGGLSAKFDAFADAHKSDVNDTTAVVVLKPAGKKGSRVNTFRYALTFTLPNPAVGQGYFKKLFQRSFFLGDPYAGEGFGLTGGLEVLGYLEGAPNSRFSKHRPFIARVMASKGRAFKTSITKLIKTQAI